VYTIDEPPPNKIPSLIEAKAEFLESSDLSIKSIVSDFDDAPI